MSDLTEVEIATYQQGMTEQQKLRFVTQFNASKKSRTTALIISLFLGIFGVDRFYVGDTVLGLIKLLTFGGLIIWCWVDWFLIMGRVDAINREKAQELAMAIKMVQ